MQEQARIAMEGLPPSAKPGSRVARAPHMPHSINHTVLANATSVCHVSITLSTMTREREYRIVLSKIESDRRDDADHAPPNVLDIYHHS